jgi:hypothetical protein
VPLLSGLTARLLPAPLQFGPDYNATTALAVVPMLVAVTLVAAGIPARRAFRNMDANKTTPALHACGEKL